MEPPRVPAVFRSHDGTRTRETRVFATPCGEAFQEAPEVARLLEAAADAVDMDLVLLGHVNGSAYTAVAVHARRPELALPEGTLIPIGETYCREELTSDTPFVLGDAQEEPRFASHPGFVTHGLRAYVGVPIVLADGTLYGTLCAADVRPRNPTLRGIERLQRLARLAATHVERRLGLPAAGYVS